MKEKRRREEATGKEHNEEEERRSVAAYRKEREMKLEHARRAKAAVEENPNVLRKGSGLVALSSLLDLLVLWFIYEQYCLVLDFSMHCHVLHFKYGHT
jgi:hypothetical protein